MVVLSLAICGSSKRIWREQWRIEAISIEVPLTVWIQGQILVRVELLLRVRWSQSAVPPFLFKISQITLLFYGEGFQLWSSSCSSQLLN